MYINYNFIVLYIKYGTSSSSWNRLWTLYSNKGDDLIQIRHFGVFTLRDLSQYGEYPACPEIWYQQPTFHFNHALDNAKKISIRLRLKPHDRKPGNFRDFACAVRFDLNTAFKSPFNLDIPATLSPLTQYWCNTFKKVETDVIARVENDNEEETEPIVIDGCSIMGEGRKRRTRKRRSRKTRKTRRVKKRKHKKRKSRKHRKSRR